MTAELQDTASALEVNLKAVGILRVPNTVSNRKVEAVLLRLLEDGAGRALYTFEEMSALLDSADRRNTHNFWREFAQAGADCQAFCERQRKLNRAVHAYIEELWRRDPLLPTTAIGPRVNARVGLADLSAEAVRQAATQLDDHPIRRALRKQLERGDVHYREEWLFAELFAAVEQLAEQVGADQRVGVAQGPPLPRGPALLPKEVKQAPIPRARVAEGSHPRGGAGVVAGAVGADDPDGLTLCPWGQSVGLGPLVWTAPQSY
ncbi:MAG: hypothetical protein ACRERE_40935 [Candidatus Entotheonellia bacterium]